MKNILISLIFISIFGLWLFYFLKLDRSPVINQSPQKITPTPLPKISIFPSITISPVQSTDSDLTKEITAAYAQKYGRKPADINLKVSSYNAKYAKGSVNIKMYPENGGWFLAYRDEGVWKIIQDGNGSVSCVKIKPYEFPLSMVSECVNSQGKLIKLK